MEGQRVQGEIMGWRELFAQWNTKTLGGSTKLGVSDYELITDGVHVEVDNLAALEAKNTVGQATNLQSQSGPIPGTQTVITSTVTDTGAVVLFTPEIGEVWQYVAGCRTGTTNPSGNVTTELDIYDATNDVKVIFLDQSSSSTSDFPYTETNFAPTYISYPFVFRANTEGTFDSTTSNYTLIRVR
jgi:hypothetical protein